jgi:hypothetical protein
MLHTPPQVRQLKVLPRIHDIDIDPRLLLLGLHETDSIEPFTKDQHQKGYGQKSGLDQGIW